MFIPDQTKNDLAELLGDKKTLRKLKKTTNTASSSNSGQPSVFGGGIGDFDFGDGCGDGACQSRHERREMQRNAAKAVSSLAKKPEKFSWRQIAVGGVLLITLSGGLFSTVWTIVDYLTGASLFPFVDVKTQEGKLKDIFFSGEPYVVYCQAGRSKLVPKLVIEGTNMLPRGFATVMLNCDDVIPSSGQNVFERFGIDKKEVPAFVVANGEKPKQFNRNSFYNPEYFAEFAKVQTTPKMKEVTNETQLRNLCTEQKKCVAIGHKGKLSDSSKTAIEMTMSYWRKQRFVSIDTSKFSIKLDYALSASLKDQIDAGKTGKEFLSVLCYTMPEREVDSLSPAKASVRRATESDLYYVVKECMSGSGLSEINQVPSLEIKKKDPSKKSTKNTSKPQETKTTPPPAAEAMEVEDIDDGM